MSRKYKHYKKNKPENKEIKESLFSEKHHHVFKALLSLALAVIIFLSLFDLAGLAGDYLALGLKIVFGKLSIVFPFFFLLGSFLFFSKNTKTRTKTRILIGCLLLIFSLASLLWLFSKNGDHHLDQIQTTSGYLGFAISYSLEKVFAFWGALVILIALLIFSLFLIIEGPLKANLETIIKIGKRLLWQIILFFRYPFKKLFTKKEKPIQFNKKEIGENNEDEDHQRQELFNPKEKENKSILPLKFKKRPHQKIELPIDLLNYQDEKAESRDINEGQRLIKKTLENFGIPVEMTDVRVGPTVTQYALRPKEGIKLSRITALSNDLSMALAAHPIRIEAPIPGKSLVGIEVPNKKIAVVSLREVLESEEFKKRSSNLTVPLGKDVTNNIWLADIKKMPHLLISGATNSGKTVMIHSIITTLLYENSPDDLRFILIDPKRVELILYDGMPHLLAPVITKHKEAINALHWAINEMERRLDLFKQNRARDIASFNQTSEEKLPYIIIIIDELADLMMASSQDIEAPIVRLAQLARATGIHLVLATQKPSVDIITGLIKSNITSRIAFNVASMVDSRTILDHSGAEKLLGRGDMLFLLPHISKPKRVQAPFVSDKETERIVGFLRDKEPAEYLEEVTKSKDEGIDNNEFSLEEDELLPEARDVVLRQKRASATLLQRYLRIGYARAARLIDMLEKEGVVGQADGSRPRQVFGKPEDQSTEDNNFKNEEIEESEDEEDEFEENN